MSNIVTLPRELAWYGANWTDSPGTESDKNPTQMVIDACNLADPDVDFSLYDMENSTFLFLVLMLLANSISDEKDLAHSVILCCFISTKSCT